MKGRATKKRRVRLQKTRRLRGGSVWNYFFPKPSVTPPPNLATYPAGLYGNVLSRPHGNTDNDNNNDNDNNENNKNKYFIFPPDVSPNKLARLRIKQNRNASLKKLRHLEETAITLWKNDKRNIRRKSRRKRKY
jgi:hypothetical protein